jgi:hypothetical protein
VIAPCAEAVRPTPRPLPDAETQDLRALVLRRRQVLAMLTAERKRLGTAPARIQQASQPHIAWLEGQLAELNAALTTTVERSAGWQAKADLVCGLPGVGPVLARAMLAQVQHWALWATSRWRCWSASHPATALGVPCEAAGWCMVAGRRCAWCCTWAPWSPRALIPSSQPCRLA